MESLYRKYRPLTFDSVVGQEHIVSTLEHAISEGRLSHAYLFCGPRGTGKTTMARILAKALLCQQAHDDHGCMPDGTCPECSLIAEGTHPDVYELDAASRTGVDNVREEIISSVNFAPVRGRYKVYIIDEVHMLTTAAFNALLKTLEEPPAHVVFILCTTDPQKILETILSRCQRFDFHRIGNADIEKRLAHVCEQEGFEYDEQALEIVARHARGGMRDALSTLEQLSVFGSGVVRVADARSLLGEASNEVLGTFVRGIAKRDVVGLFELIRGQADAGNDIMELTRDLVAHTRDVYVARVAGAKQELFEGGEANLNELADEAAQFESADRVARTLGVLDDAALQMRTATDARLVLEVACTKLARPEGELTLEALAERVAKLEARAASGVAQAPMDAAALTGQGKAAPASAPRPAMPVAAPEPQRAQAAEQPKREAPAEKPAAQQPAAKPAGVPAAGGQSLPWASPAAAQPAPKPVSPVPAAQPAQEKPVAKPVSAPQTSSAGTEPTPASIAPVADEGELQRKWSEVIKRVTKAQPSRGALLQSSRAQSDDGSKLVVQFPKGSSFSMKMVGRADSEAVILPIMQEVFGQRALEYVMAGAATAPASAAEASGPAPESRPASAPAAPAPVLESPVTSKPASPMPVAAHVQTAPTVDAASGPTVLEDRDIEADRKAWESEQVPYDDAAAATYDDQPNYAGADASPAPAPVVSAAPAPAAPSAPATPATPASALFNHEAGEAELPQTIDEAKALLRSTFGNATIFKIEK